jgi:flagellin-like hook-associated protein FlgL
VSLPASQIFDGGTGPSTSALQALTALYNDLASNNLTNLGTDADNIASASGYLNGQQALYGEMQNQVTDAVSYQSKLDIQLKLQLSTLQDADSVSAITTLQQASVAEQAALQAHAAMPTKSLFSFIG